MKPPYTTKTPRFYESRSFTQIVKFLLSNTVNSVRLSVGCFWYFAVGITDYAMTYADIFLRDTEFLKKLFALLGFEFFLGTVNPATAKTQSVRLEHHIAHYKTAVINTG